MNLMFWEPLGNFTHHLNSQNDNIKVTAKIEENKQIPFLDMLILRQNDGSLMKCIFEFQYNFHDTY